MVVCHFPVGSLFLTYGFWLPLWYLHNFRIGENSSLLLLWPHCKTFWL